MEDHAHSLPAAAAPQYVQPSPQPPLRAATPSRAPQPSAHEASISAVQHQFADVGMFEQGESRG